MSDLLIKVGVIQNTGWDKLRMRFIGINFKWSSRLLMRLGALGVLTSLALTACLTPPFSIPPTPGITPITPQVTRAAPLATIHAPSAMLDLRDAMRKLWEDHVFWTRLYIISVAADLPDKSQTAQRLFQNQVDLGNAVKPYYGDQAGEQLTTLLKEHIQGAVDILDAAKAGDTAKMDEAKTQWAGNADKIAEFLNGANPDHWPLADLKAEMKQHLDVTLEEATARLNGNVEADAAAYDKVQAHILHLADRLSAGIIQQFPDKFNEDVLDNDPAFEFHVAMRQLWEDHITWTRLYIVEVAADLPNKDQTAQRLLQNQTDIGNAVKPYYGDQASEQLIALLKEHIQGAVEILSAFKAGDAEQLDQAKTQWHANADEIAAFLNSANSDQWPLAALQMEMDQHLDLTLDEATNRLTEKWMDDVSAYDKVQAHMLHFADVLSLGIVSQFPEKFK